MFEGLTLAISPTSLLAISVGVASGILVGALPGFTATMGTALLLPFTFALPPNEGLAMLGALYVSSQMADAIPACLVNTPGTPAAVATAFDGFPLTKQGRGQAAIVASGFSALVGTAIGGLAFMFLSGPLANVALEFGPPEFFWVGVFALTIIGSIAGDSLAKGMAGGAFGALVATIGISETGAVSRYTFGLSELRGGINIVAALIGVFAIPQVLKMVQERHEHHTVATYKKQVGVALTTIKEILAKPVNVLRSSVIGTVIGILPGAGGPIATLVSYNEAMRWSKDRQRFGKGAIEGVVASEAAGNSCAGGAMVPLVALGIPGSAPAAVILGALLLQGVRPGPQFFTSDPELVYSFAWAIIVSGLVTFIIGVFLAGSLARIVLIPVPLLAPIVLFLSVTGAFAIRNSVVDVFFMLGLGVIVALLGPLGFHPGPIGLGIILGPIVEPALVQAMALAEASSVREVFFSGPVNLILIALSVISILWVVWSRRSSRTSIDSPPEPAPKSPTPESEATASRSEGELDRGPQISVDLVAGLTALAVGAFFLLNAGGGASLNWLFPQSLSYLAGALGVLLVILGLLGTGQKMPLVPGVMRGHGWDLIVFTAAAVAYVVLLQPLGFWIPSALMVFGVSVYLNPVRSRTSLVIAVLASVGVCVLGYVLFARILFVPLPEPQWFSF